MTDTVAKPSLLTRFLGLVEKIGNALPHPATLFALLGGAVILLSWILSELGLTAKNLPNMFCAPGGSSPFAKGPSAVRST